MRPNQTCNSLKFKINCYFRLILANGIDINKIKKNLPYIIIYNDKSFYHMMNALSQTNFNDYVKEINQWIIDSGMNVLVLDILYMVYTI